MSREPLIKLKCEFCDLSETFSMTAPPQTIVPKLTKWHTLGTAADTSPDQTKYFDTRNCLNSFCDERDRKEAAAAKAAREFESAVKKATPIGPVADEAGATGIAAVARP